MMRTIRSLVGAALAALYAIAFVVAYLHYAQSPDDFFAGVWLSLAAVPYILTTYWIFGTSDFVADSIPQVLGAAAFCCALAYGAGALVEASLRGAYRLATRGRRAKRSA